MLIKPSDYEKLFSQYQADNTALIGAIERAIDICEFEKLESATSLKAGMYMMYLILEEALDNLDGYDRSN